jgi:hypothetical protein
MPPNQHDTDQRADAAYNGQLKTPVEARQAVKTRHVRWMLAVSLSLGVVAMGSVLIWYVSAQPQSLAPSPAAASAERG